MMTWLLLNSVGLAGIAAVLFLVLRQIGFLLQRVGLSGARGTAEGPRIGENLAHYLPQLQQRDSGKKAKLIIFGSDSCSICSRVRSGAEELAKSWKADADILLIYDCLEESDQTEFQRISTGLFFKRDCHLRRSLGATFVPFGIVTDPTGTVAGKGLVNEIGHLESLLELEKSKSRELLQNVTLEKGAEA
jgi:hypothetical protein